MHPVVVTLFTVVSLFTAVVGFAFEASRCTLTDSIHGQGWRDYVRILIAVESVQDQKTSGSFHRVDKSQEVTLYFRIICCSSQGLSLS